MSEVCVHVQHSAGDGNLLVVHVGAVSLPITELRIRPLSNFATPHEIFGRGGARLAVTDRQLVEITAEYLRFRLSEPIKVERSQVGFSFSLENRSRV
jgi:hypothetical protein